MLSKGPYIQEPYLPKLFNEAKATLHFQDPIQRLVNRYNFEKNNDALSKHQVDYFHLYEQVTMRGGLSAVESQGRWSEVIKSMPFSHFKDSELKDLYQKNLLPYEKLNYKDQNIELLNYKICVMFQPLRTFLSNPIPCKLRSGYLLDEEVQFIAQSKILHEDQYACLKVIALSQKNKGSFLGILHQIEQKTSSAIADRLIQVFQYFLLNFAMDLNLYDNPYDKNIGFLQKLKSVAQYRTVAILGCSLRNYITAKYLNNFGFKITLYVDDKKENTRQNMEILEYAPIFVDSSRFDQVVIFLAKEKLQWFMFQTQGIKLYNREGDLLSESLLQYSRESLLSILHELTKEDDSASLRIKFFEKLEQRLPRCQLSSPEDRSKRSNIIFQFHKMFWQSKLMGKQTTIGHLKKFLKLNVQNQYLQSICGDRLYMLKDCIKGYRHHLSQEIKWKDLSEIKLINRSTDNGKISIEAKGKSFTYDYLICSHSNQFVNSVRDRYKQDEEPQGSILQDNPGFSDRCIEDFRCFEQLEQENYTHYALLFNEIFWSKDAIFSLVGQSEDDKELVFFLDGTSCNQIFNKQSSLLIAVMFIGRKDFRDRKQAQTYLLQTLGQCLQKSLSWLEQQLKEIQVLHSSYFVPNAHSDPKKVLDECLNPVGNIFFNIPLQIGGWGDQLSSYMSNSLNIISRMLKQCLEDPNQTDARSPRLERKVQLVTVQQMLASQNNKKKIIPVVKEPPIPVVQIPVQDQNLFNFSKFKFGPIPPSLQSQQQLRQQKLQKQKNLLDHEQNSQNTEKNGNEKTQQQSQQEIKEDSSIEPINQIQSVLGIQAIPQAINGQKEGGLMKLSGLQISETVQFNKFLIHLSNIKLKKNNLLMFYSQLELRKPLKFNQKSYIIQFGYTNEIHRIKKNRNKDNQDILMDVDDSKTSIEIESQQITNVDFISIIYLPSMFTKNHNVHYYFHKLFIDESEEIYFSLVPEDNQRIILFHQNLNCLWNYVQRRILFINQPDQENFINIQHRSKQPLMTIFDQTFPLSIKQRIAKNFTTQSQDITTLLDSYFNLNSGFFAPMDNKKIEEILLQSLSDLVHPIVQQINYVTSGIGGLFLGFHHPATLLLQQISKQNKQSFTFDKLPKRLQNLLREPTINQKFPIQLLDFKVDPNCALFRYSRRFYSFDSSEVFANLYIEFQIKQRSRSKRQKLQETEVKIFLCNYDSEKTFQEMHNLAVQNGQYYISIQKAFSYIFENMKWLKRKQIYALWTEFVHVENISYECKNKTLKILNSMLNKQDHRNKLNQLGEQLSHLDLSLLTQNLRQLKNVNPNFLNLVDGKLMFSYSLQDIKESNPVG